MSKKNEVAEKMQKEHAVMMINRDKHNREKPPDSRLVGRPKGKPKGKIPQSYMSNSVYDRINKR